MPLTGAQAIAFNEIKDSILGKKYDLSVALLSPAEMRKVTLKTKKKNKASNVLSFPLSPTSGEILLCPATAHKEAKDFGMTPRVYLIYLFIHGLFHLKGMEHSDTMEAAERQVLERLQLCKKSSLE